MSPRVLKADPGAGTVKNHTATENLAASPGAGLSAHPFRFREFSELESQELHLATTLPAREPLTMDTHSAFEESQSGEIDLQKIIQKARSDAEGIVKKAREEAAQIEKTAYERGLREGQKSGELIAQQQVQPLLARFQAAVTQLLEARQKVEHEAQLEMAELVLACAEKVVASQLTLHPSTFLAILRDALLQLKNRAGLVLFVSSPDFAFLKGAQIPVAEWGLDGSHRFEEDAKLSRGSIRIQTLSGELDGRLESKMGHLSRAMAEVLKGGEG